MAPGRIRGITHILIPALISLAGCGSPAAGPGTAATVVPVPITASPLSTTTSSVISTTTTVPAPTTTTTVGELPEIDAEVRVPEGEGRFPAVVLVHGGAWVAGAPSGIRDLAVYLTGEGFLTVNTRYQLSDDSSPGFPGALDDVACAVRYAAAHPQSDGTVAIVGHSAGAHLSAVVALTGDLYGEDCPIAGSGVPQRLVGIAGAYDVSRLGFIMIPFFGAGPNAAPDAWQAGNPQRLTDENPDLSSLILIGERDGLVDPSFADDFNQALLDSGAQSLLEVVEGARHTDLVDPGVVGVLIVTWLER
ncbi:MAG TPA: alpha/beta hydrolase [Acidimicrobiia bacterium]